MHAESGRRPTATVLVALLQLVERALPAKLRQDSGLGQDANGALDRDRHARGDGQPRSRRAASDASGFDVLPEVYGPPEGCACFSLCHPDEVRAFFIRLPVVTTEDSPWYDYLRAIYHTDSVPLPK
jgi:hypothetical protein